MAEISSIKGWRYNKDLFKNIDNLTSPLFDISINTERLYQNPFNSIQISSPRGNNDSANKYQKARDLLAQWKNEKIIIEDNMPCIYVYYQYFKLPNDDNEYCRKGFICNVKISDWNENIILRHENTIPDAVNDRLNLLENIQMNTSPTHGIYSDLDLVLEKYMDESIKNPVYETIDYQGVKDIMSIISDTQIIDVFIDCLNQKKIIIADGHHRYESSLIYKKEMEKSDPDYNESKLYNYHLMYLSNSENNAIKIFPTHRIIKNLSNFNEIKFLEKLSIYFNIQRLDDECGINEQILKKQYSFGIILQNSVYCINLKSKYFNTIDWNLPKEVRDLEVTVLHYFIIFKVLGINENQQRSSGNVEFKTDFTECFEEVQKGNSQAIIITKAVSMDEIKAVCYSGNVMPQKSTFFYPKVICGFVFSSL